MAYNEDIRDIWAGENKLLSYTILDADDNVQDITGWSITWAAGAVTATVGAGIDLTNPTNGVLEVTLTTANTTTLQGTTAYTLRRTDVGYNTVLAYGKIRVK